MYDFVFIDIDGVYGASITKPFNTKSVYGNIIHTTKEEEEEKQNRQPARIE